MNRNVVIDDGGDLYPEDDGADLYPEEGWKHPVVWLLLCWCLRDHVGAMFG